MQTLNLRGIQKNRRGKQTKPTTAAIPVSFANRHDNKALAKFKKMQEADNTFSAKQAKKSACALPDAKPARNTYEKASMQVF